MSDAKRIGRPPSGNKMTREEANAKMRERARLRSIEARCYRHIAANPLFGLESGIVRILTETGLEMTREDIILKLFGEYMCKCPGSIHTDCGAKDIKLRGAPKCMQVHATPQ